MDEMQDFGTADFGYITLEIVIINTTRQDIPIFATVRPTVRGLTLTTPAKIPICNTTMRTITRVAVC